MKTKHGTLRMPKMGRPTGVKEIDEILRLPLPEENEQDVRTIFSMMMAIPHWHERIIETTGIVSLKSTQEKFPGASALRQSSGKAIEDVLIEFEPKASNFSMHMKDWESFKDTTLKQTPVVCICWIDDHEDVPGAVPDGPEVYSLKDLVVGKPVMTKEEWTEEDKAQREFLNSVVTEFREKCPSAKIGRGAHQYQQVSVRRGGEHFEWWLSKKWGFQVGFHIEHNRPEKAKKTWGYLLGNKKLIEKAFGEPLTWRKISDKWCVLAREKPYNDHMAQKQWAVDAMVRLYSAVKPVLDKLKK